MSQYLSTTDCDDPKSNFLPKMSMQASPTHSITAQHSSPSSKHRVVVAVVVVVVAVAVVVVVVEGAELSSSGIAQPPLTFW
jgi:hypothetical protein